MGIKPKKVSEEKPRHTEIGQCTSSCRRVGCPDEDTKDLIKHYSKTFTDLAKHDTQPDSWEKEFNKEFNKELFIPEEGQEIMIDVSSAKVRSFISQLLSTERAKHQLFRKAEQEVFDETIAEARHEAYEGGYKEGQKDRTREIIKEIEIMELNIHDLDFPIDRCIAGEKSEREKALELAGEIIMPKVKEALKSHLKSKYLSE